MAERRRSKGKKLGSSRRLVKKQDEVEDTQTHTTEETSDDLFIIGMMEKIRSLFDEDETSGNILITRTDMERVSSILFCSVEELELLFDDLNSEGNDYLTYEELASGLRKFIQSSNSPLNQKRKRRSKKRMEFPEFPSLEEADTEERKQFMSFMEQLGANNIFEDENEIWKLWTRLAQDEPNLLENLEEFLAKVTSQIKEARVEKENLEMALKKRISEHTEEVQHLYEEMEQQINAERIKLLNESDARSSIHSKEMKKVIGVKNKEVQQLVGVQDELERELHKLRSTQQVTKSENEKLKRTNQDLEEQLEKIRDQLSEAQSCLVEMKQNISQNDIEKEKREVDESMSVSNSQFYQICFQDPSLKNKINDHEEITVEPIHQHEPTKLVLKTYSNISNVPANPRTRVISIEEDPMPEYLIEDHKLFDKSSEGELANLSPVSRIQTVIEEEQYIHEEVTKGKEHNISRMIDIDPQDVEAKIKPKTQEKRRYSSSSDDSAKASSQINVMVQSQNSIKTERSVSIVMLRRNSSLDAQKAPLHQAETTENDSGIKSEKTDVITNSLDKTKSQDGSSKNTSSVTYRTVEIKKDGNQKDVTEQMEATKYSVKYRAVGSKQDSLGINKETHQSSEGFEKKSPFKDMRDADHVYKIMFVGNSNVGKTSFLEQVHGGSFKKTTSATVGLDYRIKNLIVDNRQYVLQLWDTAGQERFHSITEQFFRKADGIVIMYDVTSKDSFNAARYWLNCIKEKTEEDIVILLIGNKIDCDSERKVAPEQGEQLAHEYKLLFTECSASSGINITEALRQLARSLKAHEEYMKNNVVKIGKENEKESKSCCM
ncbi:ras-related protein Rab-44 [Pelobates fuscus]|uniref:ras-related protein Rab-44 n=1 Tax=Pelobates fuscus TaxID=191477 RepID=UPI002FE45E1C